MGSHNHSNSSSSTNLVSHPLRLKSSSTTSIPPMPLPHRQGFSPTPELPDTSFYRLCHELASHSQSGLINGPIDQRCRNRTGNGNGSPRGMAMRAWESTSSIPLTYTSTSEGTSQSQSQTQSQSGSRSVGGSLIRQPAGQIITADGIVLGANLDRYSSGMEIGRSTGRGRDVGGSCHEHVMSFMHYGSGGGGGNGGGRAERGIQMLDTVHGDERVHSPSSEELRCQDATAVLDGLKVLEDDDGDVPPAYDGRDGFTDADIKSLAGMMEMGVRT
ncbi:hypothetical protein PENANT_c017G10345 [Penicillium antarcticum]|uniref:Uncharacterized protein n=1 Tax=Penicillium antarcticum TaxID=416450 RepID=A0A1V6Q3A9_9EURO|nr:uncharacterized protein N7508_005434 [Penicillium antarcticum]KAJ5306419.1 hypothetical protein N7508_005434 [Penicillium antarcticum]OQD83372.1 hypothetical protein PENANT_c017G10345 [Penicillium antarcticum]